MNAILDPFEDNLGHDVITSLLYDENSLPVSREVKNETITSVREIQRMYFPRSLVEESMDVVMI